MDSAEHKLALQRRAAWIGIAMVVLAITAIVFEPTRIVVGVLTGDAFFRGRPTRYWTQALSSGPAKRAAAVALLEHGSQAGVPVLMQILTRESHTSELRCTAVEILTKLGPDAAAARAIVVKTLREGDAPLQAACAAALPEIGVPAGTAVPHLTMLLKTPHSILASKALRVYRGAAAPALPDLIDLLRDLNRPVEVRWNAARTIGLIGPAAASAVRLLTELLGDEDESIREHCAAAIGNIGPQAADEGVPALIRILNDPQAKVRRSAVTSLGSLGEASRPAISDIKKLLRDEDPTVREAADAALQAIAP